jgi:hypothetical protein
LIGALAIFVIGTAYSAHFDRCSIISAAEKGVTEQEIASCARLNLYQPITHTLTSAFPRFVGLGGPAIVLLLLIPSAYLTRKKNEVLS